MSSVGKGLAWQQLNHRLAHSEIIIEFRNAWRSLLPHAIEAFVDSGGNGLNQHAKFLQDYGLTEAEVPLLNMQASEWGSPVSKL